MKKSCKQCGCDFDVTDNDLKFYEKVSPIFGGKRFDVPAPTLCPDCRAQRRTIHRNEYNLYRRTSALSNKPLISIHSPETNYKVFSVSEWFSDDWDEMDYGRNFDFGKPFFEQFHALQLDVPHICMMAMDNENSDYTTGTGFCKNCYLINSSEYCEDCWYGKLMQRCKNAVDCSYVYDCELIYECFNSEKCYNCKYVYNSQNASDSWFCDSLKNCRNCFLCTNLVGKEYHFENQKLSQADYENKVSEILNSPEKFKQAMANFDEMREKRIYKYANVTNSENCTGDFLKNSKNCENCYDVSDSEDMKYVQVGVQTKDLMDCSNMYVKPELSYEVLGTIGTYNVHFCLYVFNSNNLLYCESCFGSQNCFGCMGLRNKKYCIFNKQYTQEEYEALVPKIIEHMRKMGEFGEFFPHTISPHSYNETVANEYYPLSKEDVLKRGFKWKEIEAITAPTTGNLVEVPENIKDVGDDICDKVLTCEKCSKRYKILKHELDFYRKMKVPAPKKCPDCRYFARLALRPKRKLFDRKCMKCEKDMKSVYTADRTEIVYCEECYLKEVY